MTNANEHPTPRAFGPAPPHAGGPLAAYRAALAKVEPGEAFLARTRRALAEAGGLVGDTADPRGQTAGRMARTRPGWSRPQSSGAAPQRRTTLLPGLPPRAWLTPLWRGLLPAACLALLLLAVPAGRLLGGGASFSGGAADEQLVMSSAATAEDTSAAQAAPTEDYAAPAGEPAAADTSPADSETPFCTERDTLGEAGASGEGTDGASPAGSEAGGSETHKEIGGAPPAGSDAGSEGAASAEERAPAGSEEPAAGGTQLRPGKHPAGIAAERIRAA